MSEVARGVISSSPWAAYWPPSRYRHQAMVTGPWSRLGLWWLLRVGTEGQTACRASPERPRYRSLGYMLRCKPGIAIDLAVDNEQVGLALLKGRKRVTELQESKMVL